MRPSVSPFFNLKDSLRPEGIAVAEGWNLAERAVNSGVTVISFVASPSFAPRAEELSGGTFPVTVMTEAEISAIAGFKFHRGVICAFEEPDVRDLESFVTFAKDFPSRFVAAAVPHLTEADNLGAIARTAACFGVPLLIGPRSGDPFSRICLRSSMGGILRVPLFRYREEGEAIEALSDIDMSLAGTVLSQGAVSLSAFDWPTRACVVFGNESSGISDPWLGALHDTVMIPMAAGMDSLNVAVAAGIFLHHATMETKE